MFQRVNSRAMARGGKAGLIVATLASLGLAASAGAADPWPERHGPSHSRGGWGRGGDRGGVVVFPSPRIVIGGPRVVVTTCPPVVVAPCPAPDVVPADLQMTAYQSRDTVIIVVNGTNARAGFTTALTCVDRSERTPTVVLRNAPGSECGAAVCTPFSLSASICVPRSICDVQVRVAGRVYQVPVTAVPPLG